MRSRIAVLVVVIQSILFFGHWFLYCTWSIFWGWGGFNPSVVTGLKIGLGLLSVSFVTASLLAFRYNNLAVRLLYKLAAVWLGFLNFFFLASWMCWIVYLVFRLCGVPAGRPWIAGTLFGAAVLLGLYGVVNAAWIRTRRITVELPGLPESWQNRAAALVSDTHLGHVHGNRFMRRIVRMLRRLKPDIIFIAGDLYDGTKTDCATVVSPWKEISPCLGTYFITGNHEEFSDSRKYTDAVMLSGIRVLANEMSLADGVQIVGVSFGDSTRPDRFRDILGRVGLDRDRASILLSHAPHSLQIAEQAGISLQLSGHTHGGQIVPFTWITKRIFGQYTYGLRRFGQLLVYTSYGAGTWGPPLRVGTRPEIVLIRFKRALHP